MKRRFQLFEWFAIGVLILVTAFITISLLAVILGGFSALRESLFSDEVQFAVKLSLATATISTVVDRKSVV